MGPEITYIEEKVFSDRTRYLLIYAGIGAAAGVGTAVLYNEAIYRDVRDDYDTKTAQTEDLEQTAEALKLSEDHLVSEDLIEESTATVMKIERLELTAEAQAIRNDTPNIILEQLTWAGAGVIPGIALAIGAWATHRKWKKHRQQNTRQDLLSQKSVDRPR